MSLLSEDKNVNVTLNNEHVQQLEKDLEDAKAVQEKLRQELEFYKGDNRTFREENK